VVIGIQPISVRELCNPAAGAAVGYGLATALSGANGIQLQFNYTRNRNSGSTTILIEITEVIRGGFLVQVLEH
jgi:hypothetical protein